MKAIGILGGMGPAATVDLFDRIVKLTPARRDQEHRPVYVVNNPAVPDRSQAILNGGDDPVPSMVDGLNMLARMGAAFAVIPCNTAHYYLEILRASSEIPILDMIAETVEAVGRDYPGVRRVGILATSATLRAGLYQRVLGAHGLTSMVPTEDEIDQTMCGIYGPCGVKTVGPTQEAKRLFARVGDNLVARGAEALILGCTEIPLALKEGELSVPLIASNEVLAAAAVRESG